MGEMMNMAKAPLMGNKSGWSISPPERMKYEQLFRSLEPVAGYLPGNKVKGVLMDSKLPLETLGKIWDLADRDKDGRLSEEEFIIAMHLVYKALENYTVPSVLPAELLDSISNVSKAPIAQIPTIPPMTPIPEPTIKWIVSSEDQAAADKLFVQADKDMDGFVSGLEIKDVFLQSGLSQVVLAHIWGLCDMYQTGKLNKEQFALSMYLIKQKLNGCDLPNSLTPNMIPPSLRKDGGTAATASAAAAATTESATKTNTANYSPEMNMMIQEVDMIIREKRTIEQDISQKEADVKIKSGEIKSLQSELDTLCATLRQLDNQKGEAQKRLNDLKTQIDKLRQQATDQESTLQGQEEELAKKRQEIESLRITEQNLETQQNEFKKQLSDLSEQLRDTQLQISQAKANITELEEQQRQIIDAVAAFDGAFAAEDASAVPESFLSLRINLDESKYDPFAERKSSSDTKDALNNNDNETSRLNQENANYHKQDDSAFQADFSSGFDPAFPTDPFQNQTEKFNDPFNDYKADHVGFNQPAQVKDPFGEDPFAALHAPTKDNPSPALPPKKKPPPPRPAPPKSARASPNPSQSSVSPAPTSDPFAANAGGGDFGFADFSKFNQ